VLIFTKLNDAEQWRIGKEEFVSAH